MGEGKNAITVLFFCVSVCVILVMYEGKNRGALVIMNPPKLISTPTTSNGCARSHNMNPQKIVRNTPHYMPLLRILPLF